MIKCRCHCRKGLYPLPGPSNPKTCNIPLTSASIKVLIHNGLSTISISQEFSNLESHPIECEYAFATPDESVVTGLKLHFPDGSVLVSSIEEQEKASELYQDAISGGNTAVLSKSDSPDEMTIFLGNLAPNESIKAEFTLAAPLSSEESFWKLQIPTGFIPISADRLPHFEFSVEIKSNCRITSYSSNYPLQWAYNNVDTTTGTLDVSQLVNPTEMIWVKFRTDFTNVPTCIVQQIGEKYAAMMSFVPFSMDEAAEDAEGTGEFLLVLDRSGSMSGERIEFAKKATVLFLKSLPSNSKYNIISFGSVFSKLHKTSMTYNSQNIQKSIKKIEGFEADMGGTDILEPLRDIFSTPPSHEYPRTLFLLTDGEVSNAEAVINLIKTESGRCRVHGFGIGDGVDEYLISKAAKAGKGHSYFIKNNKDLGSKIINSLKQCMMPCLNTWAIDWIGESYPATDKIGTVYYGEMCVQYILFDSMPNTLPLIKCFDNFTNTFKELTISSLDHIQGDQIFKLWAKKKLEFLSSDLKKNRQEIIGISKQFGIPSEITAFICVKENSEPVVGEMVPKKVPKKTLLKSKARKRSRSRSPVRGCASRVVGGSRGRGGRITGLPQVKHLSASTGWRRCKMAANPSCGSAIGRKTEMDSIRSSIVPSGIKFRGEEIFEEEDRDGVAIQKIKKISKSDVYTKLVSIQLTEGYWEISQIKKILPEISRIPENLIDIQDKDKVICTVYVLCYLQKFFSNKHDEWILIEKKSLKWLKMKKVDLHGLKETISKLL